MKKWLFLIIVMFSVHLFAQDDVYYYYYKSAGLIYPFPTDGLIANYDASSSANFTLSSNDIITWKSTAPGATSNDELTQSEITKATYNSVNKLVNFSADECRLWRLAGGTTEINAPPLIVTNEFSIFVVAQSTADQHTSGNNLVTQNNMNGAGAIGCGWNDGAYYGMYFNRGAGITKLHNTYNPVKDEKFMGEWTENTDGLISTWVNGINLTVNAGANFTPSSAAFYLGWYFIGNIHHVMVYNRALTDIQRIQVENYLNTKWSVYTVVYFVTGDGNKFITIDQKYFIPK
jgi:hypothetical protein